MNTYEQLVFMGIVLSVVTMAYFFPRQVKKETFGYDIKQQPPILETRTAATLLVMYELTTNSLVNTNDINVIYKVWSSTMTKRGMPEMYVTPEVFDRLRHVTLSGGLTPQNVMITLQPFYVKEHQAWEAYLASLRKPYVLRGVCSS